MTIPHPGTAQPPRALGRHQAVPLRCHQGHRHRQRHAGKPPGHVLL